MGLRLKEEQKENHTTYEYDEALKNVQRFVVEGRKSLEKFDAVFFGGEQFEIERILNSMDKSCCADHIDLKRYEYVDPFGTTGAVQYDAKARTAIRLRDAMREAVESLENLLEKYAW